MKHFVAAICVVIFSLTVFGQWYEVTDSVLYISPETQNIKAQAFKDRTDFHTVRFGDDSKLNEIGEYAFLGCLNLRDIEFPAELLTIGEGAFRECPSLRSISLPPRVQALPKQAFAWCAGLEDANISSATDIGSHAFVYCNKLEKVNLSPRLEHVGSNAFSFCGSLREISLPPSVRELESYAFAECTSLCKAELPGNDNLLGELIFSGCRNLREITIKSKTPPTFDCNSTLFEPSEAEIYDFCTLKVPGSSEQAYHRASGWCLFKNILSL